MDQKGVRLGEWLRTKETPAVRGEGRRVRALENKVVGPMNQGGETSRESAPQNEHQRLFQMVQIRDDVPREFQEFGIRKAQGDAALDRQIRVEEQDSFPGDSG